DPGGSRGPRPADRDGQGPVGELAMRRLVGGLPRTYRDHRRKEAVGYRAALRAVVGRLGPPLPHARVTLREYGRLAMDLQRLHEEQDRAVARGRVTVARRIDRRLTPMRTQLLSLEARLEELAAKHREAVDPVDQVLADLRRETAAREAALSASLQRDGNG